MEKDEDKSLIDWHSMEGRERERKRDAAVSKADDVSTEKATQSPETSAHNANEVGFSRSHSATDLVVAVETSSDRK